MREIKFRAKIKNNDNIFDVTTIDFGNCVVCIVDPERGNQEAFDWSEIESLLQFTGLHDENGKEIYEGDIVRGEAKDPFVIVPMLGGLSIHNINNLGQKHNELISMPTNDAQTASWLMASIVIGNIYSNPELVEGR